MSVLDPIKAPLQARILNYIKQHCCMSASASFIARELQVKHTHWGTIGSSIRSLRDKGLIVEIRGRYHYYECEKYE